jgi:hypothetical protein
LCQYLREYFLENRTITTDTVHDSTDAIETDTLAHVLHERGRISVASNQPANRILDLACHFIPFRCIIPIGFYRVKPLENIFNES